MIRQFSNITSSTIFFDVVLFLSSLCLWYSLYFLSALIFKLHFTLSFQKTMLKQNWNSFNTNFRPQWKDHKSSWLERQLLAYFLWLTWSIFCLKLWENLYSYQSYRKLSILKRCGGEFEAKNCFQRQSVTKYLRQNLVFMWNHVLGSRLNFYFLRGIPIVSILAERLGTQLWF